MRLIIKFYFLVYFNSTLANYNMQVKIVSAHRTPEMMFSYASSALERGIQIIIAGAGVAAHLPGKFIWTMLHILFHSYF